MLAEEKGLWIAYLPKAPAPSKKAFKYTFILVENLSTTVKIEKDKKRKEKLDRFLAFSKSLASTPV